MILYGIFTIIYVGFLIWCRYYWQQIDWKDSSFEPKNKFSIIVPVRNEEKNIAGLIDGLAKQEYPKEMFEIVLVDDYSDDNTAMYAEEILIKTGLFYQIIKLGASDKQGKKRAITAGVKAAKHEIIITVDGDCTVDSKWVSSYNDVYCSKELVMVTGPVRMRGERLFDALQVAEFSGLIGIGAASLQSGNPGMCNGANMSYKKKSFDEVGGYEGNFAVASGDDEFLLQKIYNKYKGQVSFLKDKNAVVYTATKATLGELISQRVRWSSKWKFHKSWYIRAMAILLFAGYCSFFYSIYLLVAAQPLGLLLPLLIVMRWLALWYYAFPISRFFGISKVGIYTLLIEILYPIVVLFLGIASIFGYYSWKGRKYS